MKKFVQVSVLVLLSAVTICGFAEEQRNQYSSSIMFSPPEVHEDVHYLSTEQEHEQHCRELRDQVKALKNKPIRKNAAYQRYEADCLGN